MIHINSCSTVLDDEVVCADVDVDVEAGVVEEMVAQAASPDCQVCLSASTSRHVSRRLQKPDHMKIEFLHT